jgi:hypothetical protein
MVDWRVVYRVMVGNLRESDYLGDRGLDGIIIIIMWKKLDMGCGLDRVGS